MAYFVLAGGYWGVSKDPNLGGKQVNPGEKGISKSIDYIIKIDGLPKSFLKPISKVNHKIYYCKDCERVVPEGEIQEKFGCFKHNLEVRYETREKWDVGIFEKYSVEMVPYLQEDTYRVWVNSQPGKDKWAQIWKYVERTISPLEKVELPVPVGRGQHWTVKPSEIPTIKLEEEKAEEKQPEELLKCTECGLEFKNARALAAHKRFKHK